jgi:hypothetical protein
MDKDKNEFEAFEATCHEVISAVLSLCEKELARRNYEEKALPYAALAVRESILAFLALAERK